MFDLEYPETATSLASATDSEATAMQDDEEKAGMTPYDRLHAEIRADTDAQLAEVDQQIRQHARPSSDPFMEGFSGQPGADGLLTAIATPAEMQRTSVRIMLMVLHRGLEKMPTQVRQLPEARALSQALYAASEFFNRDYDPTRSTDELRKLSDVLAAFAGAHRRSDPWMLALYAMGDLKARKRQRGESTVVPFRR